MLKFEETEKQSVRIKVIGIGGGGSNAVDHMTEMGIKGVEFAVINTDSQVLAKSKATEKIQIGKSLTRGLGTGGNPELGQKAALDDKDIIMETLEGVDIAFITAGFGGGTGTGASPVVANIARQMGALTVGVITKPFTFEGKKRMAQAEIGLLEFYETVDTIITVPNDKIFDMIDQETPMHEAYRITDRILYQAVESLSKVIIQPGLINLDFSDIRTILSIRGAAVIGFGEGSGKDKAAKAVQAALATPLLETRDIHGAKGILISLIGGNDLSLYEVNSAIGSIHEIADENANIIIGAIIQADLKDKAMVTLIATGLEPDSKSSSRRKESRLFISEPPVWESERISAQLPVIENEPIEEFTDTTVTIETDAENHNEPVDTHEETTAIPDKEYTQEIDIDHDEEVADSIPELPQTDYNIEHENRFASVKNSDSSYPQSEFFEKSDPTLYNGSNLDIPSFMRKKKTPSKNEEPRLF